MNRKFLAAATIAIAVTSGVAAVCPAALADDTRPQPSRTSIRPRPEPVPVSITATFAMETVEFSMAMSVDPTGRWQSITTTVDSGDTNLSGQETKLGQLSPETLKAWQRMATSDELAREAEAPQPVPACDPDALLTFELKAGEVALRSLICYDFEREGDVEEGLASIPPTFRRMLDFVDKFSEGGQPGKGALISLSRGKETVTVLPEGRWTQTRQRDHHFLPSMQVASGWLDEDQLARLQQLVTGQEFGAETWLLAQGGATPCPAPNQAYLGIDGKHFDLPCNLVDPVMLPITNEINRILTEATSVRIPIQPAICPHSGFGGTAECTEETAA